MAKTGVGETLDRFAPCISAFPPRPAPIASQELSKGCMLGSFTTKSDQLEGRVDG